MPSSSPRRARRSGPPARARCSTSPPSNSPSARSGEALKRSGIPAGDVDDLQMGECSRAAATSPATPRSSSASPKCPASRSTATARRAWRRCTGAAQHHGRHGQGRHRGRRGVDFDVTERDEADHGHRRHGAVDVAVASRDARRARRSTCRSPSATTPRARSGSPAKTWTCGRTVAPRAVAGDRRRPLRGRDLPDRGHAPRRIDDDLRGRRAPAPGDARWRSSASLKPLHPEIDGFRDHRGQLVGPQRRRLRAGARRIATTPRRTASSRSADRLRGRRSGSCRATPASARSSRSRRRSSAPA